MDPSTTDLLLESNSPLTQPSIPFSIPNMSDSDNLWKSSSHFNSAGMQVVYQLSNLTLSSIFPSYDQYLGYAQDYEELQLHTLNLSNLTKVDWERLVLENRGPLGFILGAALFIVILTLWGVGWVFSKCCCGDKGCFLRCLRSRKDDDLISAKLEQKRDKCKRNFCGVVFAGVIVVFMFGLVCCFVTNEQMRMSVEEMPQEVDNSLADVDLYLNTTKRQINALFIHNYAKLSDTLNHILDQSGEIIKNGLSTRTGAHALNNLSEIVQTVEEVRSNVIKVEQVSKNLKSRVERLKNGLFDSKTRLLNLLDQCQSEKCVELKNMPEIRSIRVQNDFQNAIAMYYPKLPNMTEILRELSQLLATDIRQSIQAGRDALNKLGARIKQEVDPVIPSIQKLIDDTGKDLSGVARSLNQALDSIPVEEGRDQVEEIEVEIKKYDPFRYYAVLGVCLTLSFIFTLLTLGIFVGFCGRQPGSDYSNECCSRKTGSSFINCGIFFIFLTGGVLMVVAVVHFILAGTLTQVVCEAIQAQDNRTQEAFHLPKLRIDNKYKYEIPPYHEILEDCKNGASAYVAFELEPVYNIDEIMNLAERFKIKARDLASQVTLPPDATENIVFLSSDAKQQLARFSKSKITRVKFDAFANQLEESILSVDLNKVIDPLNRTVEDSEDFDIPIELRTRLQNEVLILGALKEKILMPIVAEVNQASDSLRFLFNQQKDLAQRIEAVAEAAERAQEALHSSGAQKEVRQLADEFEGEFIRHVEGYANFTYINVRDNVGDCTPLYNSLNATMTTFCHKIGSPLSAFWFSLTCLLLLFIPLLMVGMVLARLYKRYKYLGYESDTYYSNTYGDGDTIPLSMSANGRVDRDREDTRGGGGGGGGPRRNKRREPAHSSRGGYQNRFDDTSQNFNSMLANVTRRTSLSESSSSPISTQAHRRPGTNIRFIDSPTTASAVHGGDGTFRNPRAKLPTPPPPPYAVAIRYTQLGFDEDVEVGGDNLVNNQRRPSSLRTDTEESTCTTRSSMDGGGGDYASPVGDDDESVSVAWGSNYNHHHTPPASGEYERPPPYYYPGPAN